MKSLKYLTFAIVAVAVVALVWFLLATDKVTDQEQGGGVENVAETDEETPELEADVYPLYDGVEWGSVQKLEGGLLRVASKPVLNTTNIAVVAMPFTDYYHQKLTAAGWEQDIMREASGPGANVSTYIKGDRFIVISFETDFKVKSDDPPSECPCDVTLSITSGKE